MTQDSMSVSTSGHAWYTREELYSHSAVPSETWIFLFLRNVCFRDMCV
jgi:hypothetical protein